MAAPAAQRYQRTTMTPVRYLVTDRRVETADTVTLTLAPLDPPLHGFTPGRFAMLYAFGVGEVPISMSGRDKAGGLVHTLRSVGAVTAALHATRPGEQVGVRGPFGTGWALPAPVDADVVVVAGGVGLAPLRPLIRTIVTSRPRYRSVTVLIGARTPGDLLYGDEYARWRHGGAVVEPTVDRAAAGWNGHVGVVTTLFDRLTIDPAGTVAYLCGPEVMMRFAGRALVDLGVPAGRIEVSLERNMRCGIGHCGHCQLGPWLLCRDGPVVPYAEAVPLLATKEL